MKSQRRKIWPKTIFPLSYGSRVMEVKMISWNSSSRELKSHIRDAHFEGEVEILVKPKNFYLSMKIK